MTKAIKALFVSAIAVGIHSTALAIPVLWTISDYNFTDGSYVSGSFVYDAETNTYGDIEVILNNAAGQPVWTYNHSCAGRCSSTHAVLASPNEPDLTGVQVLNIGSGMPLTNAGGWNVANTTIEGVCLNANCTTIFMTRTPSSAVATLTGVPLSTPPTPSNPSPTIPNAPAIASVPTLNQWGLMLLASLLGGFAFWRQRRHS